MSFDGKFGRRSRSAELAHSQQPPLRTHQNTPSQPSQAPWNLGRRQRHNAWDQDARVLIFGAGELDEELPRFMGEDNSEPGEDRSIENAELYLPLIDGETWEITDPHHRCPQAIVGCYCFAGFPAHGRELSFSEIFQPYVDPRHLEPLMNPTVWSIRNQTETPNIALVQRRLRMARNVLNPPLQGPFSVQHRSKSAPPGLMYHTPERHASVQHNPPQSSQPPPGRETSALRLNGLLPNVQSLIEGVPPPNYSVLDFGGCIGIDTPVDAPRSERHHRSVPEAAPNKRLSKIVILYIPSWKQKTASTRGLKSYSFTPNDTLSDSSISKRHGGLTNELTPMYLMPQASVSYVSSPKRRRHLGSGNGANDLTAPRMSFDRNRCRRCKKLDVEEPHMLGEWICCQNDKRHGQDEHWFHLACVAVQLPLDRDVDWFCMQCIQTEGYSLVKTKAKPHKDNNTGGDNDHNEFADTKHKTKEFKGSRKREITPLATGTKFRPNSATQRHGTKEESRKNGNANNRDLNPGTALRKREPSSRNVVTYGQAGVYNRNYMDDESDGDTSNDANRGGLSRKREKASSVERIASRRATPNLNAGANAKWTDHERATVRMLMHTVMRYNNDISKTEMRWAEVERLSKAHGLTRTATAIKNHWNRNGRLESGLDERNKPDPSKLVTGVQDPEARRKTRDMMRETEKTKGTCDDYGILFELDEGSDDIYERIAKRPKRHD